MNQPMQPLQPFDYTLNVPNPAEAVTAGLQQGVQLAGMMERTDAMAAQRQQTLLENQALQAKAQRTQQFQQELGKFGAEGFSAKGLNELMLKYPEAVEQLKTPYANLSTQERETKVAEIQPIVAALNAGDRVTAGELLNGQVEALRNAGKTREADAADVQKNLVLYGDLNAAQTSLNTAVAMAMGPEKYGETFGKLEDQRRDRMLEDSTNIKAYTDAKISEAKAKFAELREQLEVDKLKPKPMGVGGPAKPELSQKDKLNAEGKLRDDFTRDYQPIAEQEYSLQRLNASQDNAAGDLALIFNYMKLLDPRSAVKETEFATAQNAAGVEDRVRNVWNKVRNGEFLSVDQRKEFRAQAVELFKPYKKKGDQLKGAYTAGAKRNGLDPASILLSVSQDDEPKAAAQPGPVATPAAPTSTQAAPTTSGGGWSIVNVSKGK
jgi:hypothetical protein